MFQQIVDQKVCVQIGFQRSPRLCQTIPKHFTDTFLTNFRRFSFISQILSTHFSETFQPLLRHLADTFRKISVKFQTRSWRTLVVLVSLIIILYLQKYPLLFMSEHKVLIDGGYYRKWDDWIFLSHKLNIQHKTRT